MKYLLLYKLPFTENQKYVNMPTSIGTEKKTLIYKELLDIRTPKKYIKMGINVELEFNHPKS